MSQFARKQILLVEDEALIAMSEKMQLEKYGYAVSTVSSGEEAVEAVQTSSDIDLILMDINLGSGIDGTEAAEIILRDQDIPIVFLSSHTEPEIVEKTEKITSYGYVVKNSSITVLDASIKMAFRLFDSKVREQENQKTLRQITESMEEVFWLSNRDNTEILYVSPSYEEVWGRTCQSLYDTPHSFLDAVYDDDRPAVVAAFDNYARGERFDLEYRIERPEGDIRWIRAQTFPVRNDAGDVVSNSGIAMDITTRKQAEEGLEKRLVALTHPLDDPQGIDLDELFSIVELQRLQDQFADATGVASIITRPDGTPITEPSNFRNLCDGLIRATRIGRANCLRSDAALGRPNPHGPTVRPCLSGGLWDAGAAISVGGRHIANWLIGQVRDEEQSEENIRDYAGVIGADEDEMVNAFQDVPAMSREKFQQIAEMLFTFASHLSRIAYQNVQQARFITERKQAEEAMTEQRNFAESLIETAQTIILVLDADGNIVRFNPYTAQLLGYTVDEIKGQNWVETCVEPGERPAVQEVIRQTMIDTQTRGNVNPIIARDGRRILVEWSNNLLLDTEGRMIGVLATGNDITDHSRVENTLHESILRHRELEARIPVGVYIVWIRADGNKEFEYVSDRWCEIHGVSREAVLADAAAVDQLIHPADHQSFVDCHQESSQQKIPFQWEGRFFDGEGEVRWFRIESTPLPYDDGNIRWFGVSQDITDQKRMEQQLTDQKQHLERILETTSDGFWVVAPDKRITRVNPAYCHMSGYSRDEITAMGVNDLDAVEDPEETASRLKRIMEHGSETFETEHRRKDGSICAVEVTSSRLDDAGGVYLVSFIRDISERKRSEIAIQKLLAEKEVLIGEIQHRIKNNINIMTSLLSLQAESVVDTTAKGALIDAKNRLDSLGVLYDYLHGADANGHGSLREYMQRLLAGEVTLFSDSQRVAIRSEIEDCVCPTKVLSTVGLILNELITNAMKYAFRDHPSPMITVTGTHGGEEYTLTVSDNGPGMPEPDARQSSGFGYTVVNAMVQQLDGTIVLTNDHGTRAEIVFPLHPY